MVVGFNHNFRYRGEVFHVQTEDGGLRSPNIITLLYRGGTILASKKTSYADIAKVDNLEKVVEELMKEQHKEMLRRLRDGEYDDLIAGRRPASSPPPSVPETPSRPVPPAPAIPAASSPAPVQAEKELPPAAPPATELAETAERKVPEPTLDDVILSYLVGDDQDQP